MVLLRTFEKVHAEFFGHGKQSSLPTCREQLESKNFKNAVTAAKFLMESGFPPAVDDVHWVGFVRALFHKMSPALPMIGQLCSKSVLKDYVAGRLTSEENPNKRTREELREIYAKVLIPEFRSPDVLTKLFGV